jgi:predicted DNA-binding transcriptional regulator YafY
MAGIPIVTYSGVNGGIGIMPEYKVDKHFFTSSEISNLLMGLGSISTVLSHKDVTGTLEKIKTLVPDNQASQFKIKSNQIKIDLAIWMDNSQIRTKLELIKKALNGHKLLSIDYRAQTGSLTPRRIEPYQMVLKQGQWYLQAYCILRNDFRIFKITRMAALRLLDDEFEPRQFESRPMDGTGWIDKKLITIQLRVHWSLEGEMLEHCGKDKIKPCGKEWFEAEFPFTEDEYGYNMLLGFGDKCECIGPDHVRNELLRRIRNLLKRYNR